MIIQGQVQQPAPTSATDGNNYPLLQGKQLELIVAELMGKYYTQTVRGNSYYGAITGQVTTVGLATTYTGLSLSNPIGSNVNLVISKAGYSFIVAFTAGATVGLMAGFNGNTNVTHTTPVTVRSNLLSAAGPANAKGFLDSAATLPTAPFLHTVLDAGDTGAITTAPSGVHGYVDIDGAIVLPPGGYVAFYTSTASGAAGGAFSFSWTEVPL